ncbi:hypothetical protein [Novosphingobium colocasiae]|uniref:hypothetical protein n=1 Tax=Novosphingobium colocasiae TaxID=1256513 RepID=UPI0035AE575C
MTVIDDTAAAERLAKRHFIIMRAANLCGAVLVVLGMLVFTRRLPVNLPPEAGYALAAIGLFEALILPRILARAWRSRP